MLLTEPRHSTTNGEATSLIDCASAPPTVGAASSPSEWSDDHTRRILSSTVQQPLLRMELRPRASMEQRPRSSTVQQPSLRTALCLRSPTDRRPHSSTVQQPLFTDGAANPLVNGEAIARRPCSNPSTDDAALSLANRATTSLVDLTRSKLVRGRSCDLARHQNSDLALRPRSNPA